jgi:putative heme-binding domain-containing protein
MKPTTLLLLLLWLRFSATTGCAAAEPPPKAGKVRALFDGVSLEGWQGEPSLWRVEDGMIVGGSMTKTVTRNEFLATTSRHTNFILRLKFRLAGTNGFINSGVQIRSDRVPDSSEMAGYQCDIGEPTWWGSLYDESRRNRVLAWSDIGSVRKVLRPDDWNDYVIRADGARITTWINGVVGVDYFEPDAAISRVGGRLGFQIHGGGAVEARFRDITLEALPEPVRAVGASKPVAPPGPSPLPPEVQAETFSVPPGFVVELVAAEPDGGKFVPIAFDHAGRLWTTTALEYPVDANESPALAKTLFERGGQDRIVVFDTPTAPGRQKARTFAEGLAIPLGVLPYKDGAYVQYGSEIRLYRDTDRDGRADRHQAVLTGFGIEDSHLFPHQFTRAPGNWLMLAQGAFNSSKVQSSDGGVTTFNRTKMARFRPDGSRFETIGWGPCNIWGLVLDRHGEVFIQEANDQGWPLMPFLEGASYPLCGDDIPRPYSPPFPKTGEIEMGGTGLSGLALSEGSDAFPAPWRDVFFVANPITRKVQAIRVHRGGSAASPDAYGNGWQLEHLPDFLLSSDPWFRPVAMSLGPDGCLYIVDWYNQVISHNEIPRAHPDRDKTRGRIWRVRHQSQPHRTNVPDLDRVPERDLLSHLSAGNAWEGHAAWQAIVDREARGLIPALRRVLSDRKASSDHRLRALWALEGLSALESRTLRTILMESGSRSLRREVVRASAGSALPAKDTLALATRALADPDRLVRQEAMRASSALLAAATTPEAVRTEAVRGLLEAAAASPLGDWTKYPGYHRDFERYIVRSALESRKPDISRTIALAKPGLTVEARVLASLVLGGSEGARQLARLLPTLGRSLSSEELLLAAQAAEEPASRTALEAALADPATLAQLHAQRARIGRPEALLPLLTDSVRRLLAGSPGPETLDLGLRVITGFRLAGLEAELVRIASAPGGPAARQVMALRALRETGSAPVELLGRLSLSPDDALRREVVESLAASRSEAALPVLLRLWPNLGTTLRRSVVDRIATTPAGARRLLAAIAAGELPREDLDGYALDRLAAVLPQDPEVGRLRTELGASLRPVLRLDGAESARVEDELRLAGAFTVESWVRLEPGLSNTDSLLGGATLDLNFHDSRFRVYVGAPHHDIVVDPRPATAEAWTHFAVTRDAEGLYRIYRNGEWVASSTAKDPREIRQAKVAGSTAPGGTAGDFAEFRVWDHARSADQIRSASNLSLRPGTPGMLYHGQGATWGKLGQGARVDQASDLPPISTEAEAARMESLFAAARERIAKPGDVARGKALFTTVCGGCHAVAGQGGRIGPALDGAGAHGDEALLRNILTPNAAMEAGYRRFRIETADGEVHEGLLAASDAESLTLRQANTEDRRFPQATIRKAGFLKGSLMPEGLLDGLKEGETADLFSYLRTLGTGPR